MTREEIISQLKRRQGEKSLREFARELDVSAAYLCDIYLGRRDPGPKILRPLKMVKVQPRPVTTYEKATREGK